MSGPRLNSGKFPLLAKCKQESLRRLPLTHFESVISYITQYENLAKAPPPPVFHKLSKQHFISIAIENK